MSPIDAALLQGYDIVRIGGGVRRIRLTELGQEQLCARCHEAWPMDPEFFSRSGHGVSYECKACVLERKKSRA